MSEQNNFSEETITESVGTDIAPSRNKKKMRRSTLILGIILPLIIVIVIIVVVFKIKGIFHTIRIDSTVTQEDIDNYVDSYDVMVPLTDENGYLIRQEVKKIVVFGNYPFAADADSPDGMAALLAEATGAEVINCSIEGSRIGSSSLEMPSVSNPMDIYTPYYLTALMSYKNEIYDEFIKCGQLLGADKPSNADEVVKTLYELDPSEIDVFVFMYDSEDYWVTQRCIDSYNEYSIDTVCGNLISAFRMIKMVYTNNRIIYMSPYFNLYENEDGTTETCEFHIGMHGAPSTYFFQVGDAVNKTAEASFVDNLYGTITEDNYEPYLSDTRHLTQAGRQKLIDRLVYAINYFNKKD